MLFAFGNTDPYGTGEDYIFCAPQGGRIAITGVDPGYAGEQGCTGAGDLSFRTNLHLTAVFDSPAGLETWYTNGVLVSSNTAVTVQFTSVQSVSNFIGHSLYTADPYEDLYPLEFRIYNGALSPADVAASQLLGPSALSTSTVLTAALSGGNMVISWPLSATGFSLYSSTTLGPGAVWTLSSATVTTVGQSYQATVPANAAAQQFFQLKK
jgi:hypothetical protein